MTHSPRTHRLLLNTAVACSSGIICSSIVYILIYLFVLRDKSTKPEEKTKVEIPAGPECPTNCRFNLTETIPWNLTLQSTYPSTFESWKQLVDAANSSIDIISFYWSMLPNDLDIPWDPSAQPGIDIFNGLITAAQRGIKIRIMQHAEKNDDTKYLAENGYAQVRSLNFKHFQGAGVLHTKMWLVDNKHFYLGSANLDWRSLSQVKELGVIVFGCDCLGYDLAKMVEVYWAMGIPNALIPSEWPTSLGTAYDHINPIAVNLNNEGSFVYFSSSPPGFSTIGRESDLETILRVIGTARSFVHISVMDYSPSTLYMIKNRYWPEIDDALRSAAFSGIHVKLLISKWNSSRPSQFAYLHSLDAINSALHVENQHSNKRPHGSITIRIFQVPAYGNQSSIPYARVNHDKYIVTDNAAYIGTSNWSGDYFTTTAGAGVVVQSSNIEQNSTIVQQLNKLIFERDWNSNFSSPLTDFDVIGQRISRLQN